MSLTPAVGATGTQCRGRGERWGEGVVMAFIGAAPRAPRGWTTVILGFHAQDAWRASRGTNAGVRALCGCRVWGAMSGCPS